MISWVDDNNRFGWIFKGGITGCHMGSWDDDVDRLSYHASSIVVIKILELYYS
jgi:hypothetical protein